MTTTKNRTTFATQRDIAKLARRVAKAVKKAGLTYDQWRTMNKLVRKLARLQPATKGKKLPRILTDDQFRRFFRAVDRAGNATHAVLFRLLFHTGLRVNELVNLKVADIDLDANRIRVEQGKGGKDRVVLFGQRFAVALRAYLAHHDGEHLFESRQGGPYTTRRVQQIVKDYAGQAGIRATPHTFRHQVITWLTRHGLQDAELQLLTGHARRDTLTVYQHLAIGPDIDRKYQDAMNRADV